MNFSGAFQANLEDTQERLQRILAPLYVSPAQAVSTLQKIMFGDALDIQNGAMNDIQAASAFARRMQIIGCMSRSEAEKAEAGGLMAERAYREMYSMLCRAVLRTSNVEEGSATFYAHIAIKVLNNDTLRDALGMMALPVECDEWQNVLKDLQQNKSDTYVLLEEMAEALIVVREMQTEDDVMDDLDDSPYSPIKYSH